MQQYRGATRVHISTCKVRVLSLKQLVVVPCSLCVLVFHTAVSTHLGCLHQPQVMCYQLSCYSIPQQLNLLLN